LEENFNDKQLLEDEIEHLEIINNELDARLKERDDNLAQA
jgi:hypothetical protein